MLNLFSRLAAIVLLKLGPQDLPAGSNITLVCILAYLAVTTLSLTAGETPAQLPLVLFLAVALPVVLSRIVLGLRGHLARWHQTLSALFGTSALLSLLTLPINLSGSEQASAPAALLMLLAFFWSFSVDAHIWRHALEVSFAAGLALAVTLFAISVFTISTLAGPF